MPLIFFFCFVLCLLFLYSIFLDNILFPLIAFCFLNSSASQFYPTQDLRNFVMLQKNLILKKKTVKKHSLHMQASPDDGLRKV